MPSSWPTGYEQVNDLLAELLTGIQSVLGEKLVGLYLTGSLALGDFDLQVSDIDLLAALKSEVDDAALARLEAMHAGFVQRHPEWRDRIEVCYVATDALASVRQPHSVVNISPGEPIHRRETSAEWLMSWYLTREHGLTLFGLDAATIIESVSRQEFIGSARLHASRWLEYVEDAAGSRGKQAYAILTLCRAFYVCRHGEQASKRQAALWAASELPHWAPLISDALAWRLDLAGQRIDATASLESTQRFVADIITLIGE
jgi:hypothetical protein